MQSRLKSISNVFILFVLLLSLFGSSVSVTPAYAAGLTVNTAADENGSGANCSLREAINAANTDAAYGGCPAGAGTDTITFAANYTITLGSQLPAVTSVITITGNGAANTILQANANPNTATYRVLEVNAGGTLTLGGMTVRNGRCNGSCSTYPNDGGGIFNDGTLTVSNSVIANNYAVAGGGINNLATVTLTDVTLSGNHASSLGGGLYNSNSSSTLMNTTVSENAAQTGGGIYSQGLAGTTTVTNSTFSGNVVTQYGGGIYNFSGNLAVTNATFSGNSATNSGAGIYNSGNNPSVKNTIFADILGGGGCINTGTGATFSNNLSVDAVNACDMTNGVNGNLIGADPLLAPLADNGGSTQTFRLPPASPAVNVGTNSGCPATDQRGMSRLGDCDMGAFELNYSNVTLFAKPTAAGSGDCLSWANACTLQTALTFSSSNVEIWAAAGLHFPTTTTDRTISFALKNTVALYGGFAGTETQRSQRNPSANVTILSGDIDHNDSQTPIVTDILTVIDIYYNSYHVVYSDGVNHTAILDGFTVTAGYTGGAGIIPGAGIYNIGGNPTITNVSISGNRTGDFGGGMYNLGGIPSLTNVTFFNNYAPYGGGIYTEGNSAGLNLTNVTFSNNLGDLSGGGMYNYSVTNINLTNVTFIGNSVHHEGGGIYNYFSSANLTNVTFSGNDAGDGGGMYNYSGYNTSVFSSLTNVTFSGNSAIAGGGIYNIGSSPTLKNVILWGDSGVGEMANADLIVATVAHSVPVVTNSDIQGSGGSGAWNPNFGTDGGGNLDADPKLGSLANNGGTTLTFSLLAGSPAINAGTNSGCPSTDQRGTIRPLGGVCDIGAYETIQAYFADVPTSYWSWNSIERLRNAGITGGCNAVPLNYCPLTQVTRAQMAIFLVRAMHGVGFVPPTATGVFPDVPVGSFGANYIEQLAADGITSGCGGGNFCPNASVTRASMAVFLVRAKHGIAFVPPTATGIFSDVPVGSFGANYIEQLAADGVTSGCGGGLYCPNSTVKRDSMAVFLVKNFSLP